MATSPRYPTYPFRRGQPIDDALIKAGQRRFRPVLLTSVTTIAGLFPILIETSFQAQILIPMATSLSFALLLATVLVLLLLPVTYRIYHDFFPYEAHGDEDHDDRPAPTARPQRQRADPLAPPATLPMAAESKTPLGSNAIDDSACS